MRLCVESWDKSTLNKHCNLSPCNLDFRDFLGVQHIHMYTCIYI